MVKVINKKGKKYLNIDGREYGPKSLYFHIQRTTSTLEYFTKSGDWDEDRQSQVKNISKGLWKSIGNIIRKRIIGDIKD